MKFACILSLIANLTILVTCQVIKKECQEKCGNVTIPYPFGIGKNCALDEHFIINCNKTYNPPTPFLANLPDSLQVLDISYEGYLRKLTYVGNACYDSKGNRNNYSDGSNGIGAFFFSSTRNNFTVIGCDSQSMLQDMTKNDTYYSGCISYCVNRSAVVNGSCAGIGCCQTFIPPGLSTYSVWIGSYHSHTLVNDFNPCSYGFIADRNYFDFTTADLWDMPEVVPTVIDWQIGNQSCRSAVENESSYACKENSECRDSDNGRGYLCECSAGYKGNPYVPGGCVDVDECKDSSLNDCSHNCHNVKGNYTCSCPKWYRGDGRKNGQECRLNSQNLILVLVGGMVLFSAMTAACLILQSLRSKRIQAKLRENLFKKNGGPLLLSRMNQIEGSLNTIKKFTLQELKEATNNFSLGSICGRGGFGIVYKGELSNSKVVAIKKSTIAGDEDQVNQFIKEIVILFQINHKNVVKLLGCCLETPVPLLVYEFITNGTLSDHIHDSRRPKMPWQTRLKIAAETAGVFAYLHTNHDPQIIHRDIKPSNILLEDDYTSKVSDFGISRLNPKNEKKINTLVQGTVGYLDVEYHRKSQLTVKSDVYSFGVVLMELLTGLKAVSSERSLEHQKLVNYFLFMTEDDNLLAIIDKAMMNEGNIEEVKQVVKIAMMCVRDSGEDRPTMKEVAMELEGVMKNSNHQSSTSGRTSR